MLADFMTTFKRTDVAEGGWANIPGDSGKETYRGISRFYNPTCPIWPIIDEWKKGKDFPRNPPKELDAMVIGFYREKYWEPMRLGELIDQDIANFLYDFGMNKTPDMAVSHLQRALNVLRRDPAKLIEDGKMGPMTIALTNKLCALHDSWAILKLIESQRAVFHMEKVEENPEKKKFIRSWLRRCGQ